MVRSKIIAFITNDNISFVSKNSKKKKKKKKKRNSKIKWNKKWKTTENFRLEQDKRQINRGDRVKKSEGKEKKRCLTQGFN